MKTPTDDLDPAKRRVLENIAKHGLHIQHVEAGDDKPTFSYTVGLWHHFEQPEVIVLGMPKDVAFDLLNAVADEADEGKRFAAGERHEGLFVQYPVRFLGVEEPHIKEHFEVATWAYDGSSFDCVQLVWPDKSQRWPWQDGVRGAFREMQPLLGAVPS